MAEQLHETASAPPIVNEPAEVLAEDPRDEALLRDARLFRARVSECVQSAVERLTTGIAADVLARELLLAPADIARIVERAVAQYFDEEPLRVRVHPDDARELACTITVVPDEQLRRGDAILELRDGWVDASFGVRLAALLERAIE